MSRFNWAPAAYRQLNGILCVFKPPELPMSQLVEIIKFNLAQDLNALPCYKLESKMHKVEPNYDVKVPAVVDSSLPTSSPDLLEHRLILGPRYIPSDIRVKYMHGLRRHSSGVTLLGLGREISLLPHIEMSRFLRVYHIKGRFGWATNNFSPKGKIIERTSYRHIHPIKLDKLCASIQSRHLRNMFLYAGVEPHSQAAYEMAATGLVRPADGHTPPVLYSVKCIDFQLPDFTLEIHAINEKCDYFMNLIHDIGLQLKSTAVCTGIRRLRYGHFELSHALLRKHWTLEHILDNVHQNKSQITVEKLCRGAVMQDAVGEGELSNKKQIRSGEEKRDNTRMRLLGSNVG